MAFAPPSSDVIGAETPITLPSLGEKSKEPAGFSGAENTADAPLSVSIMPGPSAPEPPNV
jgi:hypothetical protein